MMNKFETEFPNSTAQKIFVPYRVCPLGAHIDHQKGIVTGFALDTGMTLLFAPSGNAEVCLHSMNFSGKGYFRTDEPVEKGGEWADYAKAAYWALKNSGHSVENGFSGVISGENSESGLSTSAAVLICYIKAFCAVNGISLSDSELIKTAHTAETEFIGLRCGTLDQSCEVLCRKSSLLVLDTLDASFRSIPCPDSMPRFEIALFNSGITRNLTSSSYNKRTEELREACILLKEHAGIRSESLVLRDIPFEAYQRFGVMLPENLRKRCEHYYSEMQRVEKGVEAFGKGDIVTFGQMINQSGESSIHNYEAGHPSMIRLLEFIRECSGVYGSRFSGAGFRGCCMAIINPEFKEEIRKTVTEKYTKEFPQLAEKFSVSFCKTADGCGENR